MVQLPIFRVHYRKLEAYFCRVYGWEAFDFFMATGTATGMAPEYVVNGLKGVGSEIERQANAIRSGRRSRNVLLILNVLCEDGYIPAGRYVVSTKHETTPLEVYKALLRQTETPESKECREFRAAHGRDKELMRVISEIDTQVLQTLKELREEK
ncbi:MAG: hypothetical protein ABFC77_06380 [Thermoguttaceae bacterium]